MTSEEFSPQVAVSNIQCDLCEEVKDIEWHCVDCRENLCAHCRKVHLKSKLSCHHIVVSKEAIQVLNPNEDVSSSAYQLCQVHQSEKIQMFCETCDVPVCQDCIIGVHDCHHFAKLHTAIDQKCQEIASLIIPMKEEQLKSLNKATEDLSEHRKNYERQVSQIMEELNAKVELLKKEIEQVRDKIIQKLCMFAEEDYQFLDEMKANIETELIDLKKIVRDCEEAVECEHDPRCFRLMDSVRAKMKNFKDYSNQDLPQPPEFVSTNIKMDILDNLIGQLSRKTNVDVEESTNMAILETIDIATVLGCDHYKCLSPVPNSDDVWVGYADKLGLITRGGHVVKELNTFLMFDSLAVTKNGTLFVANNVRGFIAKSTASNRFKQIADLSPFTVQCLYATEEGGLLCGLNNHEQGSKMVLMSAETAEICRTYQYTSESELLLDDPYSIVQNRNKDIWVIERINSQVKVVDVNGSFRFIYKGHSSSETMEKNFNPYDLESDNLGRILVCDFNNHSIHLVDDNGQFLQYIITEEQGILLPSILAKDEKGDIWIKSSHTMLYLISYLKEPTSD